MAAEKQTTKKPYTAPKLRYHGDLRKITQGGTRTRTEQNVNTATKRSRTGS